MHKAPQKKEGKALGIAWDNEADTLELDLGKVSNEFGKNSQATERGLVSTLASLFDLHGLVSSVAVSAKILFRRCTWRNWGGMILSLGTNVWETWHKDLKCTCTIFLPRCVLDES